MNAGASGSLEQMRSSFRNGDNGQALVVAVKPLTDAIDEVKSVLLGETEIDEGDVDAHALQDFGGGASRIGVQKN